MHESSPPQLPQPCLFFRRTHSRVTGPRPRKTAQYIVDMERKWAEGVCVDNSVVAALLGDDFQGTSTKGARFAKADQLRDEKGPRTAHDCGLDETKVRFFGDTIALVYCSEPAVGKDKSQPNAKVCQVWTDTWLKRGVHGRSSPRRITARHVDSFASQGRPRGRVYQQSPPRLPPRQKLNLRGLLPK